MKIKEITIFTLSPSGNSCFDYCLKSIEMDNEVFNRGRFDDTSFNAIFDSVLKLTEPDYVSLAVVGMIDYAIKQQFVLTDKHIKNYNEAKEKDPLIKYQERKAVILSLDSQINEILSNQRFTLNDYAK